jgi:hypothetical protein
VPVDNLVRTSERAAQVLGKIADELVMLDEGHEARARMLQHIARALDQAVREILVAPDETPPSGLEQLLGDEDPDALVTAVTRRLARRVLRGRSIVCKLLEAAEITGDAETIAEARAWLDGKG